MKINGSIDIETTFKNLELLTKRGISILDTSLLGPRREEVNWNECQINKKSSRESLQKVLENCKIFPGELKPEGSVEWIGIPLREWYDRIITPKQFTQ